MKLKISLTTLFSFSLFLILHSQNLWAARLSEVKNLSACSKLDTPTLNHTFTYDNETSFPQRGKVDFFRGVLTTKCTVSGKHSQEHDILDVVQKAILESLNHGQYRLIGPGLGWDLSQVPAHEKKGVELSPAPANIWSQSARMWKSRQTVVDSDDDVVLTMNLNALLANNETQLAYTTLSTSVEGEGDNENLLKKDDHLYLTKVEDATNLYVLDFKRIIYIIKPSHYGIFPVSESMFLDGAFGITGARVALNNEFKNDMSELLSGPLSKL